MPIENVVIEKPTKTRIAYKFSWQEVDPVVVRRLLHRVYFDEKRFEDLEQLDRMPDSQLYSQAKISLGQPPKSKFDKQLVDIVVREWAPRAKAVELKALAVIVQAGMTGEDRSCLVDTKHDAEMFLRRQRRTHNFVTNVRKAFIAAHKILGSAKPGGPGPDLRSGEIKLEGQEASPLFEPYQHQVEARQALDAHYATGKPVKTGCLVVLPTGSGKTETMVEWLLSRLEKEPSSRVLWISHQQELVDQSISRFSKLVVTRSENFNRIARSIHGRGSSLKTLASEELDVAGVTFQTLASASKGANKKFIDEYFKRPVHVVVDEVHHAGAKSYRSLISLLLNNCPKSMVGLTATPKPTSMVNHYHLRQLFPDVIYQVSSEELIAKGILSQPILTTILTNFDVVLEDVEIKKAESGDLSADALRKLESTYRNSVIVKAWESSAERWGKTLVFATRIQHAEALKSLFDHVGADVRALHSLTGDRAGTLDWFRQATGTAVLISVGMLTEGVDVPDARTAFLARPTTSRVLLKQMIGRVLRGPRAGGEATAEIVYFEDNWTNFLDVLHPGDALPAGYKVSLIGKKGVELALPAIVYDDQNAPISEKLLLAIANQLQKLQGYLRQEVDVHPVDHNLYSTRLVGFYDMEDRTLPVFEHQHQAYELLLRDLSKRAEAIKINALSYFEDLHPPYPSKRALRELVDYITEFGKPPEFLHFDGLLGPQRAAETLIKSGPLSEKDRAEKIGEIWETTLARVAYPSLARFEEAVEQAIRQQLRSRNRADPEAPVPASLRSDLPRLPRADRQLKPLVRKTLEMAREILPRDKLKLFMTEVPAVMWTSRVLKSSFGHWSIKLSGRNAGQQVIRINRLLNAPERLVPDDFICFIIYHELLHHALPGQGHDAEFRELEMLWPDAHLQMNFLETFHERYNMDPKRYR